EIYYALMNPAAGALIITLVSLAILILWEKPFIQRNAILKYVPGPLLAVIAGITLGRVFDGIAMLSIGNGHFVDLPTITGLDVLPYPQLSAVLDPAVWKVAFTIAIVASLETLLCVEATDKMDPWRRTTPANRELFAQGLGNVASGFLGGLPVTQVIVR